MKIVNIDIRKACENEINLIYEMQQKAFIPLLEKYQDYGLNPACETIVFYEKHIVQK